MQIVSYYIKRRGLFHSFLMLQAIEVGEFVSQINVSFHPKIKRTFMQLYVP